MNIADDLTQLREEPQAERKPLDDRLFRLGFRRFAQHYAGCGVGHSPKAQCTCDDLARQARASGRFLR